MSEQNDVNLGAYSHIADAYHKATVGLSMRWQWDMFNEMVEETEADVILDLMCGTGRDAAIFVLEGGYDVVAVDGVQSMIDKARRYVGDFSNEVDSMVDFRVQDARKLDLGETFDAAWCNTGIFMFPRREAETVLERIAAHMNPGGVLYINFKLGEGERTYMDERYGVKRFESYFSPEEFRKMMAPHFNIRREMVDYGQNIGYRTHPIMDVFARRKE